MSTDTTASPPPVQRTPLKEKLAAAWDGINLQRIWRGGNMSLELAQRHMDNFMPKPQGSEDMAGDMNIGDEFHYHYDTPAATPAQAAQGLGKLAQIAIAGGLIATGAGAGAGIPMLINALAPAAQTAPAPTIPATPLPNFTDTVNDIGLAR